jgi:hypothetical protein
MNVHTSALSSAISCFAALALSADEAKTIWQPGNQYHTHIAYEISVDNADLEPGAEKCYHGRYHIPHLMFAPVIEFTTSDIVRKGENFYAQRFYFPAYQTVSGLGKVKWKTDDWMLNPRRIITSIGRYTDADLDPLRDAVRDYKKKAAELKRAKQDAADANKELAKQLAKLNAEENDARKELEKLKQRIDATEEGSKKRKKAEKRLEKAMKEHEATRAKLQAKIDSCTERVKKCRAIARQSLPTESFSVFYDTRHNSVPFSTEKQKLFFKWDGNSIDNYFKKIRNNSVLEVKIGPQQLTTTDAIAKGWSLLEESNPSIWNTIASEFGVTASAIFDDPQGKLRVLENRKTWTIDAGAINGLLATEDLKKLISFKGTLEVERFSIRPGDCQKVGLSPFSGWKVCVMDSSGAELGYDTGNGYDPFSFTISRDGKNRIEFWFDANNEVLRYAKIEIEKEDYEGNIPNPNLGKMLSQVKGTARGSVVFKCEYKTSMNQALPGLNGDEGDEDDDE